MRNGYKFKDIQFQTYNTHNLTFFTKIENLRNITITNYSLLVKILFVLKCFYSSDLLKNLKNMLV